MEPTVDSKGEPGAAVIADEVTMTFHGKGRVRTVALAGVSLSAVGGQITGLVGPDGAGKTTLIRLAAGLLVPTSGTLTVLGLDAVGDADALRGRIGYMPQQFGLYEDLTVQENLDLYADLQGVPRSERSGRYDGLMNMTGLGQFTARRAGRLSGGMKQKLGLACCLVKSPDLLLLDEPTVGVDPVSRRDLWKIVYELANTEGIGVVLSTAYLDEAERCDRIVVLHEGRKLDEGPPGHFHDRVRGRVLIFTPRAGVGPREVQSELAGRAGVLDATIRSGAVRAVLAGSAAAQDPAAFDAVQAYPAEADPTFEDAFVAMLASDITSAVTAARTVAVDGARLPTVGGDTAVVRVAGLCKRFGEFRAVENISFEVGRGEIFGLLGPNGAGKSTTFRMLCGLLTASEGEIDVAGRDLRRAGAEARTRLGYMAQKFSMYKQLSVVQNLRFYGRAYGLRGRRLRERISWALDEFGLAARVDDAAGDLPGGYRQRLAMAAALLHEPDILFLDEPTSGADPLARREFWLRISGFARRGVTVIVTTHFMEEAEYCDRMLIMSQGKRLAAGTPHDIRALARNDDNPEPTVEDAFIALAEGRVDSLAAGTRDV